MIVFSVRSNEAGTVSGLSARKSAGLSADRVWAGQMAWHKPGVPFGAAAVCNDRQFRAAPERKKTWVI